jgi:hypothetical protein
MDKFEIGDRVYKTKGYEFDGIILSVFKNTRGQTRLAVELEYNGMIHIFTEDQLELRSELQNLRN